MKKLLPLLVLVAVSVTGFAQSIQTVQVNSPAKEVIILKETSFDFGKILQGRPVTHNFEITNSSKEALKIEDVRASCGCTTPEWNREPISAGSSSMIKVGYNAAAEGQFTKTVTIVYNSDQSKTIVITGNVYKGPATSAPSNASLSLLKQTNQ